MGSVLRTLHEEHRNTARLLDAFDHQIGLLARGAEPDFNLLQAIAGYFCDYPDRCHHPKEDAVFRQLQARHPAEAEAVGDLPMEHRDARARVHRFRDNIQAIFRDQIVARETLVSAARGFVDGERAHMAMEEIVFFPIAAAALDEEDWRIVESNIRTAQDPLFGELVEEEFRVLRNFLVAWDKES